MKKVMFFLCFFFSSRRRHTRFTSDWSSDVCSSDLGKEDVAEFLADYILAPPDGWVHQWHVFYRVKGAEQGQEALLAVRNQYDQVQAYRAQMERIYNAKTTRRC